MKSKKALSFYSDIYRQQYFYFKGWSREEVEDTLGVDTGPAGGVTIEKDEAIFIWIESIKEVGDLVHECLHAGNFTLGRRGVVVSADDDEAQAYLVQWIFENCHSANKNKRLKK